MSTKYKATTTEDAYFITMTTMGWVDIFTRLKKNPARASVPLVNILKSK